MTTSNKKLIILGAVIIVLIFLGSLTKIVKPRINISVWGDKLTKEQFNILSSNFKNLPYNIRFEYTQKDIDTYDSEIVNSFINGTSPDIFLTDNEHLGTFGKLLMPYNLETGKLNLETIKNDFPQIVESELISKNYLYMMPISIDTLALYYNRDIFDSKSIANPPKTWNDILKLIPSLRQLDNSYRLTKGAIGLGDTNITNAKDILSLMIMQLGGKIIDDTTGVVTLNAPVSFNSSYIYPSEEALKFYGQFADFKNQAYAWSDSFNTDLDAFANGNISMYLGYASDKSMIEEKNPNLNYSISQMPQLVNNSNVNFGKITGFVVSKRSKYINEAWEMIKTINDQNVLQALYTTKQMPPASRNLISQYSNDPKIGIFAKQILSSKSFYHPDYLKTKEIFLKMISDANVSKDYSGASSSASQNLQSLLLTNN